MHTINDVLQALEQILADCKSRPSAAGYFAALYYKMTAAVQQGIQNGAFEDGPRMERLDVLFAQRYIDAYWAYRHNQPTSLAWKAAFDTAAQNDSAVLQHLLLGINAHINLDLGIAAAATSPGAAIGGLERDFNAINTVIAHLTGKVQDSLGQICPPFGFLSRFMKTEQDGMVNFSITVARDTAWKAATALAFLEGEPRNAFIREMDKGVADLAQVVRQPPGWLLRGALWLAKVTERGDVEAKMARIYTI